MADYGLVVPSITLNLLPDWLSNMHELTADEGVQSHQQLQLAAPASQTDSMEMEAGPARRFSFPITTVLARLEASTRFRQKHSFALVLFLPLQLHLSVATFRR